MELFDEESQAFLRQTARDTVADTTAAEYEKKAETVRKATGGIAPDCYVRFCRDRNVTGQTLAYYKSALIFVNMVNGTAWSQGACKQLNTMVKGLKGRDAKAQLAGSGIKVRGAAGAEDRNAEKLAAVISSTFGKLPKRCEWCMGEAYDAGISWSCPQHTSLGITTR